MKLIGLDFGSTTCSAIIADAERVRTTSSGKMELSNPTILFRSEPVFTPFLPSAPELIDEVRLRTLLDQWLAPLTGSAAKIQAGGAIITGLAAQKKNALSITRLVQSRIGDAVIAVADDPSLESWVSFMGNTAALSAANSQVNYLNLDVGGGTTNIALGRDSEVLATGCFWIGARHLQFIPGSYQLSAISHFGRLVLDHLKIPKTVGASLDPTEVDSVICFYIKTLESLVQGMRLSNSAANDLAQIPFIASEDLSSAIVTWSGGVGELLYRHSSGAELPGPTHYGDLGIDLARAICRSSLLSRDLKTHVPAHQGRATVYGLMLHSTHVSGNTLFLPKPTALPLRDLPLLGRVTLQMSEKQLVLLIARVGKAPSGGALRLQAEFGSLPELKIFTQRFREALRGAHYPFDRPLVLFVSQNVGKTLGQYITQWGQSDYNLIVIDEIAVREARFASVGQFSLGFVPVSFYGSTL